MAHSLMDDNAGSASKTGGNSTSSCISLLLKKETRSCINSRTFDGSSPILTCRSAFPLVTHTTFLSPSYSIFTRQPSHPKTHFRKAW
jgi:hypothetical protein